MSDENTNYVDANGGYIPDGDLADLFSTDLSGIDLSRPLFLDGSTLEMEVYDCKQITTEKGKHGIGFWLRSCYDAPNDKGKVNPAGYKPTGDKRPTETIWIDASETRDRDRILQDLKKWRLGLGAGPGPFGAPQNYIGLRGKFKVGIEKDDAGIYADKNRFNPILPPGVK